VSWPSWPCPSTRGTPVPGAGSGQPWHVLHAVRVVADLRNRHYEIPIEADVIKTLEARARKAGVTLGRLASDLLRRQLNAST